MSLTAMSLLESARRKFFMNSTYMAVRFLLSRHDVRRVHEQFSSL